MITRRKVLLGFGLGTFSLAFGSLAQQPKVARIGILSARSRSTPANPDPYFGSFVQGMRELGYVEGKNLVIEWRYADGNYERLPALAVELVSLKVDVIVSHTTPGTQALQQAKGTIPIVTTSVSDPIASGFATSLARPDRNITGLSIMTVDLSAKQLELVKIMLPTLSRIAVLINPGISFHATVLKNVQSAAQTFGMQVVPAQARTLQEIEPAFEMMVRERVNAVIVPADSFFTQERRQIADVAIRHRIATMSVDPFLNVTAGGLMGYGANVAEFYRRAAIFVDKILKGAKPADLPIEQPTTFHLAINRRTAKALGITIPRELLVRADEVIE